MTAYIFRDRQDPSVILGSYTQREFLGKGGYSQVYEFEDELTHQVYACKIIPKKKLNSRTRQYNLLAEIANHRSLDHPRVVKFMRFFDDTNNIYIILEKCSEGTLQKIVKRDKGKIPMGMIRMWMTQLIDGLAYIHSRGIIHRDLKLGNLFLDDNVSLKIGDFGFSIHLDHGERDQGKMMGTPNYISPEGIARCVPTFAGDIWAVGVILYTLIVGKPPFQTPSSDVQDTFAKISACRYTWPDSILERNDECEEIMQAKILVGKMLVLDPQARPSLSDIIRHAFFQKYDEERNQGDEKLADMITRIDDYVRESCYLESLHIIDQAVQVAADKVTEQSESCDNDSTAGESM